MVILKVTDHFNNSRSEIIKINLTEIGSEVDSAGSGLRIVTYTFENSSNSGFPERGVSGTSSPLENKSARRSFCSVLVTKA